MNQESLAKMKEIRETLMLMLGDAINILICLSVIYVTLLAVQRFNALENTYIANALLLQCMGISYLTYRAIRNRHTINKMKKEIDALKHSPNARHDGSEE